MNIEEGKTYYFYVDRYTDDDVCKAHVLHVLPHPEGNDDKLIVFRWYERHRKCWRHGVTTISQQELWKDYVNKVLACRKDERKRCKTCGMCGYYMCHIKTDGKPAPLGDCGSIGMNKECCDGINPFRDEYEELLQVAENEQACGFFKENQPRRVRRYMKDNPKIYFLKKKTTKHYGKTRRTS